MSKINELERVETSTSVDTATDSADREAAIDVAAGRSSQAELEPPDPPMEPDGCHGDRGLRSVPKKYNKIKKLAAGEAPLTPDFEFEKPAHLRKAVRPRGLPPSGGPRPEAIDPPLAIHAASAHNTEAGQSASAPQVPDASLEAGSAPPDLDPEAAWSLLREAYRHKPAEFAIDLLGITPDDWQAAAMTYIGTGGRLLSVVAGHGVGKSAFCAWLVLWHMVVFFPQKTVLTAPTQGQLFDALFAEVKFWLRRLPDFVRDRFEAQAERIVYKTNPEASFVSARTSSKEKPEALSGVHCEEGSVLLIADEASAIPEQVYEAATGSMSGRTAHTVLISNGTRNAGLFYDTHHRLKVDAADTAEDNLGKWKTMHVSCLNSKRADPAFVKQIIETYGIESNQYLVRVLGEFATREDDVLISAALVDAAVARNIELDPMATLTYGLDIARFGDDRTVLVKRRSNVVVEIKWWSKEDTMATVGRVVNEATLDGGKAGIEICADVIGIGAGVCDRLRELGYNVRDVNVSESSALNPTASRLRDDLWLQVRDWLTAGACKLPDNDRLKQDLKAPTYSFSSSGRIVVEPKALMKKRRLPSPDYADALCLTFAGDAAMIGGRMATWTPGKPLRRNMAGIV